MQLYRASWRWAAARRSDDAGTIRHDRSPDGMPKFEVRSVRSARRVGPDGQQSPSS